MSTQAWGFLLACAGVLGAWVLRDTHPIVIMLCALLTITGVVTSLMRD